MNWLTFVPLVAALAAPCDRGLLRAAGFAPGPYAVGFRAERLFDESRPWPSAADPAGAKGRPIQIALWYPAEPGAGAAVSVADLILADATGGTNATAWTAARGPALAAARASFDAGGERPLTDEEWERALATRGGARLAAAARPGRRALVLLEGGLGTRSFTLAPIAELLASHGYVVAALGTDGASEKERLGFDLAGVRAQVVDMKHALRWLRERPEVDAERVALASWSVGGVSQALLRLEAPGEFRAAVSLDSGSGYAYGTDLLSQAGGVDATRLVVPFLQFDVGQAATPVPKDAGFLRAHPAGTASRVLLEDMRHADFTLSYGAGRAAATGHAAPKASRALSEALLAFLDAHMPSRHTTERMTLASDGWVLVGDVALPDASQPVPAALLLNKAAGDRHAYRGLAEALARRGIASLRLDLRAHGESTNLGRFAPPEGLALLEGSDRDVAVGLEALRRHPRIGATRLAVVGASYSGEAMMEAGRKTGWAAAYVGLSPGSLSDDSIAAIDRERLPWLLVVCRDERYLKEVEKALREKSRSAEFLELPGTRHASDLLATHPSLTEQLALWLQPRLGATPDQR